MATFARLMRLSGAVLATAALAAPVLGQSLDIRAPSAPRATTGAAPAAAPAAAAAPTPAPEWSGESGASNHPLMTAQAIRAAAANFRSCLEGLWPQAERRGVSRAVFDANVAGLTPDLRIMDLLDSQPEFTKSFWD
jgi:membrane-bound lytic murein transglycosylase B